MSNKPERNKLYRFSEDEKAKLIEDYVASKKTVKEYKNGSRTLGRMLCFRVGVLELLSSKKCFH